MAKRDFIVKQESNSTFIEKENRTTIVGILGIVAIVLVVAIFMKVAAVTPFWEIGSMSESAITGAATYFGEHTATLQEHEVLFAQLNIQGLGERSYFAYLDQGILVVEFPSHYVRTLLDDDDGIYSTQYVEEESSRSVSVLINSRTNQFVFTGAGDIAFPAISGTTFKAYAGDLIVSGDTYSFQILGEDLAISRSGEVVGSVALEQTSSGLSGLWVSEQGSHDISFTPSSRKIFVTNLY